ncbi:FAD-dependent oxidoreductase [Vreelandella olivaria]|uniref:FAD-dependent oxidoreductase n=1 Tax=Vreelandella olivaria TaxID=390919 RepID=UPI00201F3A00|nr:FAD-dependent oxidoreductase [Halomonas olivaria]
MPTSQSSTDDLICDLLVIGSGAGGLSTAVTAAHLGLKVVVAEKANVIGGTSAWSGGWMWVPCNPLAREAGIQEPLAAPRAYLREVLGETYDAERVEMLLAQGPAMVEFFRHHTALEFVDGNKMPDFQGQHLHAATGGRSVCAAPFDGRRLGRDIALLRPPLDLHSLWGMGIASGTDLGHFLKASRSLNSFVYASRRVMRHGIDLLRYRRGMHLVNGNALVAALLKSALDVGVRFLTESPLRALCGHEGRITGAELESPQGTQRVQARCGVVLATGGFPHDAERQQRWMPHVAAGTPHHSAAPLTNTGDGIRIAEEAGARLQEFAFSNVAWAPVSLVPQHGGQGRFPHLIDRVKPGLIAVTRDGKRFANEAGSYHDVMRALFEATQGQPVEAWLICDHRFQRRYGLGMSRPAPLPRWPWLRNGYLRSGATPAELAARCGIDPVGLQATLAEYNPGAREGLDPAFGRGETPYQRGMGDAEQQPNPCVAPIEKAPFYAVKIVPGSLGTFAGLAADEHARVLDIQGQPVAGLYVAGNDMASVMGGHYPSGGITLGPAMTFGFVAAHHAAGMPRSACEHEVADQPHLRFASSLS